MTPHVISDSAVIVAASDVLVSDCGDELVLLNLRDGIYYGLDQVGVRIWSLVKQPVTLTAIRDALVSEYDVDSARCERDLKLIVTELAAKGLVEIREHP